MFQKSLLILAIAAASASVSAQAQQTSTPAKKELVARILKIQQPAIDTMAQSLVQEPLGPLLERADAALQQRVPAEKREAVAKDIQTDTRKFVEETVPVVRDRATKLAPTVVGPILEEKFTEDELKQIAGIMESPVYGKFQRMGDDMQKALVEKLVPDTRATVEPKVRALEQKVAGRLGVTAPAAGGSAPRAPARPASK